MEATSGVRGKILVVDDDNDMRETLAELLRLLGYETQVAHNGKEALDMLRELAARPGLILLDLVMPCMDGEAFRRRQIGGRSKTRGLRISPLSF